MYTSTPTWEQYGLLGHITHIVHAPLPVLESLLPVHILVRNRSTYSHNTSVLNVTNMLHIYLITSPKCICLSCNEVQPIDVVKEGAYLSYLSSQQVGYPYQYSTHYIST